MRRSPALEPARAPENVAPSPIIQTKRSGRTDVTLWQEPANRNAGRLARRPSCVGAIADRKGLREGLALEFRFDIAYMPRHGNA